MNEEDGEDGANAELENEKVDYRTNSRRKNDFLFDLCDIDYVKIDFMWKLSIERNFIRNILTAQEKCAQGTLVGTFLIPCVV